MEEKNKEFKMNTVEFYANIANNCLDSMFDNGGRMRVVNAFVDGDKAWLNLEVVSVNGDSHIGMHYSVECSLILLKDALQDAIERERHPKDLHINDFVVEPEDDSDPI